MAQLQNLKINNTDIFDLFYPIGSIYETSNSEFNPNNAWGGTWERIKGKVIVGVDEDDSDFKYSQLSGGEKSHTLTVAEMPSHAHTLRGHTFTWGDGSCTVNIPSAVAIAGAPNGNTLCTLQGSYNYSQANGGGQAHNNLQPYYTAYIWERVN